MSNFRFYDTFEYKVGKYETLLRFQIGNRIMFNNRSPTNSKELFHPLKGLVIYEKGINVFS